MGSNAFRVLVGLVFALVANIAAAKTIYFGSAPELVPVASGDTTVLHFEEPVKRISNAANFIIKPLNEEVPDYTTLGVTPRSQSGKSEVAFVLAHVEVELTRREVLHLVDIALEVGALVNAVENDFDAGALTRKTTLDVRHLVAGYPSQAVLAYSDLDLLEAAGSGKDKTRVIVAAKPTSTYRDAVLPVRVTRQKADEKNGGGDE